MVSLLSKHEALSNVDAAWLRMEDPANLMMITGIIRFDEPLDYERLKRTVEHRFLRFKRFRQRVIWAGPGGKKPHWAPDPNFDLAYHLDRITLPRGSNETMLRGLVNAMMSAQLDLNRPLWQFHLVENVGPGCALLVRLHHCIADGIALIQVLLSLTDEDPDAPWPEPGEEAARITNPLLDLLKPISARAKKSIGLARRLASEGWETVNRPSRLLAAIKMGGGVPASLGRLALRSPDPQTRFKGKLDIPKRAAWSGPVSLAEVKAIGQSLGGTVNDVLLTAMTGGLRQYLLQHDQAVKGLNFRAAVPVNLRSPDDELTLGNKFGLVFLSLPVGIADPVERLFEFRRRMEKLKGSSEAIVALGVLGAIGLSPARLQDMVVDIFGAKATCVMTNVPGPQQTLYLSGAPIRSMMFWVPQSGRLGMGISLLSYDGEVRLGVATDAGLVPDPEAIIDGFQQEFDVLKGMAQLSEKQNGVEPKEHYNG